MRLGATKQRAPNQTHAYHDRISLLSQYSTRFEISTARSHGVGEGKCYFHPRIESGLINVGLYFAARLLIPSEYPLARYSGMSRSSASGMCGPSLVKLT